MKRIYFKERFPVNLSVNGITMIVNNNQIVTVFDDQEADNLVKNLPQLFDYAIEPTIEPTIGPVKEPELFPEPEMSENEILIELSKEVETIKELQEILIEKYPTLKVDKRIKDKQKLVESIIDQL